MMREQWQDPHKVLSGALSVAVHLVLLGVLIYGVSWQNREAGPVQAELWSDLPGPQTTIRPAPPPPPEPERQPEPPKPAPEAKPAPQPKAEPTPSKADIELKAKKLEEEKRKQEQLKREEEKKKQDEAAKRKQDEAKRKEQERARQEKAAQAAAEAARQQQLAAQQAAASALINDYKGRIQAKIKRFVVLPPSLSGNPQAEFDVTLMPTGEVLTVRLTRSSGAPAYDSAVERAIYKAQPLPLPPDAGLFGQFRELHLKFRPNE